MSKNQHITVSDRLDKYAAKDHNPPVDKDWWYKEAATEMELLQHDNPKAYRQYIASVKQQ